MILYSIEKQEFWIKEVRFEVTDWTQIDMSTLLEPGSLVTQIECTLSLELLSIIYYLPSTKEVKTRLFRIVGLPD
jgi:hypothetical protein